MYVESSVRMSVKNAYAETPDQAFVYSVARRGRRHTGHPRKRWQTEAVIGIFPMP
jgi:hypothetical protein